MLKLCTIHACASGTLGLHLSRAPWDPYPWVSGIQAGSSAQCAGMRVGDTVLELNGCDVLGQKILEIATRIREHWQSGATSVTLVIWRNDADADGENDAAADDDRREDRQQQPHHGINQQSLQKFATCLQHIAQLLECPVCLEVVKPPGWQCCNGHVMCNNCRSRSVKCPVCRVPLGPRGRCLLSDKLFTLLAESFPCDNGNSSRNSPQDKRKCSPDFSHSPKSVTTAAPQQIKAKEINNKVKSFGQQDGKVDKTCVALVSRVGSDAMERRSSAVRAVEASNKIATNGSSEKSLHSTYLQQRRSRTGKVHQEAKGVLQRLERNPQDEIKLLTSCEDEQLSGSDSSNGGSETTAATAATETETRPGGNVGCHSGNVGGGDGCAGDVTEATSRYNNVLVKLKLKSRSAECSVAAAHC